MKNALMSGFWQYMISVPPFLWEKQVDRARRKIERNLRFMSETHREVHHFAVCELPRYGKPLSPQRIAEALNLPLAKVVRVLEDLERHMTFLFRKETGAVTWAYPVTVTPTPHRVSFSSGETLYAAWAVDAFATPFVQGRLRNECLSVTVASSCGHCGRPLTLDITSDLIFRRRDGVDEEPIVFVPEIDLAVLEAPSIIDDFWKESIFFWSEEHARAYRRGHHRIRGAYFTARQTVYLTRIIQSALFGFRASAPASD